MRTLDSNTVVLDWQRDGVAQGASVATTPRIRSCRGMLPALAIAIAVLLVAVGAGAMVWLDTRGESDEQFFVGLQHSAAASAPVRPPPPFLQSEPSVSPMLEPVTPDVPPARNIATRRFDPAHVSMIETGSLQAKPTSAPRELDPMLPTRPPEPVQTQVLPQEQVVEPAVEAPGQITPPAVPRSRSTVARKVIGASEARRARNTKWTATFFDR